LSIVSTVGPLGLLIASTSDPFVGIGKASIISTTLVAMCSTASAALLTASTNRHLRLVGIVSLVYLSWFLSATIFMALALVLWFPIGLLMVALASAIPAWVSLVIMLIVGVASYVAACRWLWLGLDRLPPCASPETAPLLGS
jgi:hypothetical protein